MDDTDIALVLHLLEHPDDSNKDISEKLSISQATVSRRLKKLDETNILFKKRLLPNYPKLGLALYSFVIVPSHPFTRNLMIFQLFFKNHSYTAYRNTIYGKENGLFVQLSLPYNQQSNDLLSDFLNNLKSAGFIRRFLLFCPQGPRRTYPIDTSTYDITSRQFEIDYNLMREHMHNTYSNLVLDDPDQVDLSILKPTYLKILRELYLDSSRSLEKIGSAVGGLSKQEVSRILKQMKVEEWEFVIPYNREEFGVFDQALYLLNSEESALASLDKALSVFPFPAFLSKSSLGYLLVINLPAIDVTRLTDILLERFSQVDLFLLGRDPRSYPPWEQNLQGETWVMTMDKLDHTFDEEGNFIPISLFFDIYRDIEMPELVSMVQKYDT